MPHCLGCSNFFQTLLSDRCGRCKVRVTSELKKPEEWCNCPRCGEIFEHLPKDTECGMCIHSLEPTGGASQPSTSGRPDRPNSPPAEIQYAMTHPVNPRSHSRHGSHTYSNPHHTPLSDYSSRRDDIEAERPTTSIGGSYVSAMAHAQPGVRVAKQKVKHFQTAKAPVSNRKYNIIVRNVVNQHKERLKVTGYTPQNLEYDESTPWTVVLRDIQTILDILYSTAYEHRIRSLSDFVLCYARDKTSLSDYSSSETVGHVWLESIKKANLHVKDGDVALFKLELTARVAYPKQAATADMDEDDKDSEMSNNTNILSKSKRAHTNSVSTSIGRQSEYYRPKKRTATGISGSSAYLSKLEDSVSEVTYSVIKTTCILSADNKMRFTCSGNLTVRVEDKEFASGKTKNAYKMYMQDAQVYAAKRFYFIGKRDPGITNQENQKHLREEMFLATVARKCLERFTSLIIKLSINAFDLKIADVFLITVSGGDEKGLSWIVDPFLGEVDVKKFSGTDEAGSNTDLAGMTCDAFAHFSLYDSGGTLVLVDIQGIPGTTQLKGGNFTGSKHITLFDLMAHSSDKSMGLGDHGKQGIKKFQNQHICNRICSKLGMEVCETTEDSEDSDFNVMEDATDEHQMKSKGIPPLPSVGSIGPTAPPSITVPKINTSLSKEKSPASKLSDASQPNILKASESNVAEGESKTTNLKVAIVSIE